MTVRYVPSERQFKSIRSADRRSKMGDFVVLLREKNQLASNSTGGYD
jgi:hypothetical protein